MIGLALLVVFVCIVVAYLMRPDTRGSNEGYLTKASENWHRDDRICIPRSETMTSTAADFTKEYDL